MAFKLGGIADLKQRLVAAEADRDYYMALVQSFFSGEPRISNNLDAAIIAQWGRRRIEQKEQNKLAVLLGGTT